MSSRPLQGPKAGSFSSKKQSDTLDNVSAQDGRAGSVSGTGNNCGRESGRADSCQLHLMGALVPEVTDAEDRLSLSLIPLKLGRGLL